MKHAVSDGWNWGAIKTGAICVGLAFSFSMGFQFKDNLDHPKAASAAVETTTTAPKVTAAP